MNLIEISPDLIINAHQIVKIVRCTSYGIQYWNIYFTGGVTCTIEKEQWLKLKTYLSLIIQGKETE